MSVIIILIGFSLVVATGFLIAFIWAAKSGQYDDDYTPSVMIAAFFIGLLGSVHCAGMCGPLMVTLTKGVGKRAVSGFVLYHSGRLIMYNFIGLLFGALSMSMYFFHFQRFGAIIFGILIILIYAFPRLRNGMEAGYYKSRFYPGKWKWLALGILNGLLPCGLIYLAAAGAMLSGGFLDSVVFMLAFGVGTLPALAGVAFLNSRLPHLFRRLSNLTTPVALFSGALLIYRGTTISNPDMNELLTVQLRNLIAVCGF